MDLQKMRSDITNLIDDVKYHSDALTPLDQLPIIQLNIILAKMHKMTEKTIILKHHLETYYENQNPQRKPETEVEAIPPIPGHSQSKEQKNKGLVADLNSAIGIYERYLFANELFNGSIEAYDEAVNTLNDFDELEKADYYIREGLMKEFKWEEENEFVNSFCTLVRRRYEKL